jgi:dUTPase
MKVGFGQVKGTENSVTNEGGYLIIGCAQPIIIQPSEIQKVQTNVVFQIEKGDILQIVTDPSLSKKAGEIFPACIVLDHTEKLEPLEIPVRNNGRNPIHLMRGEFVAKAYGLKIEQIISFPLDLEIEKKKELEKSKPAKLNKDIKFEVK